MWQSKTVMELKVHYLQDYRVSKKSGMFVQMAINNLKYLRNYFFFFWKIQHTFFTIVTPSNKQTLLFIMQNLCGIFQNTLREILDYSFMANWTTTISLFQLLCTIIEYACMIMMFMCFIYLSSVYPSCDLYHRMERS